jgi:hypothetical protein
MQHILTDRRRHWHAAFFFNLAHSPVDVGTLPVLLHTKEFFLSNTSEALSFCSMACPSVALEDHQGYFFTSPSTVLLLWLGHHILLLFTSRGFCVQHVSHFFDHIFHHPVDPVEGGDGALD